MYDLALMVVKPPSLSPIETDPQEGEGSVALAALAADVADTRARVQRMEKLLSRIAKALGVPEE
jgi:hypothetical protein